MKRLKPLVPPVLIGLIVPTVLKLAVHAVGIEMGLLPATGVTILAYLIYLWIRERKQAKSDKEVEKRLLELRIETDNRLSSMDKSIYQTGNFIQNIPRLTNEDIESAWRKQEIADIKRFYKQLEDATRQDAEDFFKDK